MVCSEKILCEEFRKIIILRYGEKYFRIMADQIRYCIYCYHKLWLN
jgi:hypothetical protein